MENKTLNKERPLSPHLTIYKPQITSVLSIAHRFTGFALFLGLLIFCWFLIFSAFPNHQFSQNMTILIAKIFSSLIGKLFLVGWSFCLFYHLFNGIRHLFWDIGKGFELRTVTITGLIVIFLSLIFTIVSFVVFFISNGNL